MTAAHSARETSPERNSARSSAIDIARGLAIIAIVLGHVLRGLIDAGIIDRGDSLAALTDRGLYCLHLTVFAFLAGLFVRGAVEREGAAPYLWKRNLRFLYLYVLWSILQTTVKIASSSLVNTESEVADLLRPWEPIAQFWFLPWLMLVTTITVWVRPWRDHRLLGITMTAAAILGLVSWGRAGTVVGTQGLALVVFFVAGSSWGSTSFLATVTKCRASTTFVVAALTLAFFVALVVNVAPTPPTILDGQRTTTSVAWGVATSLLGVTFVLTVSQTLARLGRYVRWLTFIGQRSLEIYLAQIIADAAARIVLMQAGFTNPALHAVLGTAAGVGLPLLLWWVCAKVHFPYFFDIPRSLLSSPERSKRWNSGRTSICEPEAKSEPGNRLKSEGQ